MDWVPVAFVVFKVLVFGTGMFFAIKWHYDQDKKANGAREAKSTRALLITGAKVAVLFILLLAGLLYLTFHLAEALGLNLDLS